MAPTVKLYPRTRETQRTQQSYACACAREDESGRTMLALPPGALRVALPLRPLRRILRGKGASQGLKRGIQQFKAQSGRCRTAKSIRRRFANGQRSGEEVQGSAEAEEGEDEDHR